MKIVLPIKRVVDYHVAVQVSSDHQGVEIEHAKKSMNPFDAIAVEEAVRIKENHQDTTIIAISIGANDSQETLRQALSMGVDRAILVTTEQQLEPLNIAKILQHFCLEEQPDIVICGKQAIDDDCNQTGQMLAALLNWPQGCFISSLTLNQKQVLIESEVDDGLETLKINLPCVLTTDLRLNEPRFAKLTDIIQAKKKPLSRIDLDDLPISVTPHQHILKYHAPAQRAPGKKLDTIDELISILKEKEVIS